VEIWSCKREGMSKWDWIKSFSEANEASKQYNCQVWFLDNVLLECKKISKLGTYESGKSHRRILIEEKSNWHTLFKVSWSSKSVSEKASCAIFLMKQKMQPITSCTCT